MLIVNQNVSVIRRQHSKYQKKCETFDMAFPILEGIQYLYHSSLWGHSMCGQTFRHWT